MSEIRYEQCDDARSESRFPISNIRMRIRQLVGTAEKTPVAIFLLASALLLASLWNLLRIEYTESFKNAAFDGQNLAQIVAANEAASIQSIDLLVRHFCNEWLRDPASFSAVVERHKNFLETLSILQIAVIGPDGRLAFSNIPGWKPVDLSDRQHFKVHKESGKDEMFISAPVLGRVSKRWTIQFTRPLIDRNGSFAGVMVASIPPPSLVRDYRGINLGDGSIVTLVRADGQVMGHSKDLARAVSVSLANTPGLHPDDPPSGEFRRASRIETTERLYCYQKVGTYPFTVYVGQDTQNILRQYHRLRLIYLSVGALSTVLMFAVLSLFISRARENLEKERSRTRYEAVLRQSEERFRLIAETIDTVVWSVDLPARRSFYISPTFEKIWGHLLSTLDQSVHPLTSFVCPEDRQRIENDFDFDRNKQAFAHEYRIMHPDGNPRWIWGRGFPVVNEEGETTEFVGVAQDITVLKRTQEEIGQLNKDLELRVAERTVDLQAANSSLVLEREQNKALIKRFEEAQNQLLQSGEMASLGQLAAGVAHEINNPIGFVNFNFGALKTYVDDLLSLIELYELFEEALPPEKRQAILAAKHRIDLDFLREDIGKLHSESLEGLGRVKRIVQDLKDFSRVGATEKVWANLEKGLDSTINVAWNEIKYKADVIREYAGIPEIKCVPSQINQVFMNLIVNAAHAIPDKGRITVRTGREEEGVFIEIEDNGSGILPEHMKRIFEPFFTTKPVGKGAGLGLSLSYGIIEKHGGKIEVYSTPGVGSRFRVTLPLEA